MPGGDLAIFVQAGMSQRFCYMSHGGKLHDVALDLEILLNVASGDGHFSTLLSCKDRVIKGLAPCCFIRRSLQVPGVLAEEAK